MSTHPQALAPSDIHIPPSTATVRVKLLEGVRRLVDPSQFYWAPAPGGTTRESMDAPVWAFLVEHASSGRRVMFDLGARKDLEGQPQAIRDDINMGMVMEVVSDVATQLKNGGVELESVEAVIWSHAHFDHHGDINTFPSSTKLLMGQGTQAHFRPGFPLNPEAPILESYFEGREVKEIDFEGPAIGRYCSHDYFGDGSFLLLDAPGHCPGHLLGLARTTFEPASFILLGGDSAHHPALFRPSAFKPLPSALVSSLPASWKAVGAPGYVEPFLRPVPEGKPGPHDHAKVAALVRDLQAFDAREDVWVLVAHDGSIVPDTRGDYGKGVVPSFPADLNAWLESGLKEKTFWAFLEVERNAELA